MSHCSRQSPCPRPWRPRRRPPNRRPARLYAGIRSDAEYKDWSTTYFAKPLSERQAIEASTRKALKLVQLTRDPWAVQHARAIWQTSKLYSFDVENPEELPKAMLFRDQAMAGNIPYRDYLVDLRMLPRATRDWLNVARPTPVTPAPRTPGPTCR